MPLQQSTLKTVYFLISSVSDMVCAAKEGKERLSYKMYQKIVTKDRPRVPCVEHQDLAGLGSDKKCRGLVQVPAAAPNVGANEIALDFTAGTDVC